ncbi:MULTISPECIES: CS1 type fimbrial major subunit [Pseudomonas]|uniref:CS1 type fimbrial major subunit n=1 Tax=Pseudomonas baetica TaxID=674054 RepID=A0ABX4PV22_9PSED|nr:MULTISPECIES: CS1 type fimbrial major subunit [Pseudomonas]MDR9863141.1 CS1 type fimbrial major subunit [Pseudomonas baetica]PKA67483.1 CS1 type fimbrial major subunit [Pseudomonas baetica]PTC18600.1 adhesin [Pseudomonas baetica]
MFKAKRLIRWLPLLLVSEGVQAITERETFEVSVTIPTAQFYVIPSEPDWIHLEQSLPFNTQSGQFTPLRKFFDVKNSNGAIAARISAEPFLSNGRDSDNIALIVTFNHKRLTVDSDLVVSELDARPGKRVGLQVAAAPAPEGYRPGNYFGSVHMIFEALAP